MRFLLFLLIMSNYSYAAKDTLLFECAHHNDQSDIDRVFVYKRELGTRTSYYLKTLYYENGRDRSQIDRVNLITKYDGLIHTYTRGTTRVKIDFVRAQEDKFSAFVRIAKLGIHSFDWSCKKQD